MSFQVFTSGAAADEVIVLQETETGTQAEIFVFGALLNAFCIRKNNELKNVVYGFKNTADAQENLTELFQSAKLSPFVCRLKEGSFTFANEKYKIEKFYLQREAIHGLLYNSVYTVKETGTTATSAFVTLSYSYQMSDKGFPFFYDTDITFRLEKENRLTISTSITNVSSSSMPISDGWHPYFTFGNKIDAIRLQMRVTHLVEFDNRLLPTGNFIPFTHYKTPEQLHDAVLDNCFVLDENSTLPACVISDEEAGMQLSIIPEKSYPYLQIYTPDNRKCIAIENLSSLPDSFNNAIGLVILEPGQNHRFVTTYQLALL